MNDNSCEELLEKVKITGGEYMLLATRSRPAPSNKTVDKVTEADFIPAELEEQYEQAEIKAKEAKKSWEKAIEEFNECIKKQS